MANQPTAGGIGELPPPVGPAVARPRRPRIWVLVAGGWMALCWLLLILSALTADIGGVLLAVVAMLPVTIVWRFRYWRRKETPFYGATGTIEVPMSHTTEHKHNEHVDGEWQIVTEYETATWTETREVAAFEKRMLGAWIAGFVFPMRDAVRELRAARGGGPADPAAG
jgi:hypothetical protein